MKKHTREKQGEKATISKKQEGTEEVFPGYPLYPASEDIMNSGTRIDVDINDALEREEPVNIASPSAAQLESFEEHSDFKKNDFEALPADDVSSIGDDRPLKDRIWPVDFIGEDLNIPGSGLDDQQEELGHEDEENNSHSVRGGTHPR